MKYLRTVEGATSVKSIGVLREPLPEREGSADFRYRKVFSVFDYGTIIPPTPLDNSTVCLMQGFNFEMLRDKGVESHYQGLVYEGSLTSARHAISARITSDVSRVLFVNRVMPEFEHEKWDYSMFKDPRVKVYVHPVEFISRNELPEASSVWKRISSGGLKLSDLGLPEGFKPGDPVPDELKPILDYSTKFEPDDRYLSPADAQELLGIDDGRFASINDITRRASNIMTDCAESRGFKRLDGKVEYVVVSESGGYRDVLGDAVCTWHEDRLEWNGVGISKQRIRDKVKELNPKWYGEIQRAKEQARGERVDDFRKLMDPSIGYTSPSVEFFEGINNLFRAGTNQWVGKKVYDVYSDRREGLEDNLNRAIEEFQSVAA